MTSAKALMEKAMAEHGEVTSNPCLRHLDKYARQFPPVQWCTFVHPVSALCAILGHLVPC
jgi:hypothetical protein